MLYPKIVNKKEKNKLREILKSIKEGIFIFLKAFSSFSSFILFFTQKFHF